MAFAAALLHNPEKPFDAAITVFGHGNIGKAAYAATYWPVDPQIIEITQSLLKDKGVASFLPSREAVLRRAWELAQKTTDVESFTKVAKLMAEINGWIAKDGPSVHVAVSSNVMVVKDQGSNDAWEKALRAQQEKLTSRDETATRH